MGRCHSLDLRARVAARAREQGSRAAARHFQISASSAVKLMARIRATGSAAPAAQGRPRGSGKLGPHEAFLIAQVEKKPDITLPELAALLLAERGVGADPSALSRVLAKAGFTYKKSADGDRTRTRGCG
jgi:transposase